jgi:hypothetical protein
MLSTIVCNTEFLRKSYYDVLCAKFGDIIEHHPSTDTYIQEHIKDYQYIFLFQVGKMVYNETILRLLMSGYKETTITIIDEDHTLVHTYKQKKDCNSIETCVGKMAERAQRKIKRIRSMQHVNAVVEDAKQLFQAIENGIIKKMWKYFSNDKESRTFLVDSALLYIYHCTEEDERWSFIEPVRTNLIEEDQFVEKYLFATEHYCPTPECVGGEKYLHLVLFGTLFIRAIRYKVNRAIEFLVTSQPRFTTAVTKIFSSPSPHRYPTIPKMKTFALLSLGLLHMLAANTHSITDYHDIFHMRQSMLAPSTGMFMERYDAEANSVRGNPIFIPDSSYSLGSTEFHTRIRRIMTAIEDVIANKDVLTDVVSTDTNITQLQDVFMKTYVPLLTDENRNNLIYVFLFGIIRVLF